MNLATTYLLNIIMTYLMRAEYSTILRPHHPDLVLSKHIDDNSCDFFSRDLTIKRCFIPIFSLANSGTTTTAGNCKTAFVSVPVGGDTGVKDSRAVRWLYFLDSLTYFCIFSRAFPPLGL